jgi:ABC-type glycerol-3-phosphate transport system substrate-binding protein
MKNRKMIAAAGLVCSAAVAILLTGCGQKTDLSETETQVTMEIENTDTEDSGTEQSSTEKTGNYKYGPANYHIQNKEFDAETVITAPDPEDYPTISLLTWTPIVSQELEDALNTYLREQGCKFNVEIVPPGVHSGLYSTWNLYTDRKEAGQSADIFVSNSNLSPDEWRSQRALYDFSDVLENTDSGLYWGLEDRLGSAELLARYLENFQGSDGGIYALPYNFSISMPYVLSYNQEVTDYYGLQLGNGLSDLEEIVKHGDALLEDGVFPICFNMAESTDPLFLNIAGYEAFEQYWPIQKGADGQAEAVDFLADDTLLEWYETLGTWREEGYLEYNLENGIDAPADTSQDEYVCVQFTPAWEEEGGMYYALLNTDEDGECYDVVTEVLDVPTTLKFDTAGVCVDGDTEYPEECLQFLELFYSDSKLRTMLVYGVEGWSYKVEQFSNGKSYLLQHTEKGGLWDYALETTLDLSADLPIAYYQEKAKNQQEARSYGQPSAVSAQMDFEPVLEEYEACTKIIKSNLKVFRGGEGADTKARLEEVHQQLLDAGLQEVLDYINAQLEVME